MTLSLVFVTVTITRSQGALESAAVDVASTQLLLLQILQLWCLGDAAIDAREKLSVKRRQRDGIRARPRLA